ncbi:MAG: arylesterase [Clostridia bacterium]|nr:arylesterase [Clostridia bacterium]
MKQILAFGDSNTWGMIPASRPPERYPADVRWTGVLAGKCQNAAIIEEGLCGRTTVFDDPLFPGRNGLEALMQMGQKCPVLDAAIIMLGTNDCKSAFKNTAEDIAKGMEQCLDRLEKLLPPEKILLISPLLLGEEVWKPEKDPEFDKNSVEVCRGLKEEYRKLSKKHGAQFMAASDYSRADHSDEEHLNATGHQRLASAVFEKLKQMQVI